MRTNGEGVKPTLRKILADSHISAVSIAVLLWWSLALVIRALWGPLFGAASFVITAVAIRDIPFIPRKLTYADRFMFIGTFSYLIVALLYLAAAWLLSRWVFGVGPLRSLGKSRTRLERGNNV